MDYSFGYNNEVISKENLNLEKIREILIDLCDEDYNGHNGEDYYIDVVDSNGNTKSVSKLDHALDYAASKPNKFNTFASIIKYVLVDNYGDRPYSNSNVFVVDIKECIVVLISYIDFY